MIGIFDTGLGGIAVFKILKKLLPKHCFLYFGDFARNPYGNRDKESIYKFTHECVEKIIKEGVKVVLIACNTASDFDVIIGLRQKYPDVKIFSIISAVSKVVLQETRFGKIGIVGTQATIDNKNYERKILELENKFYKKKDNRARKKVIIKTKACPLVVCLVEEKWCQKPETKMIIRKYLRVLKNANIDTLVLACTHYFFVKNIFEKKIGNRVKVIDSAEIQAKSFFNFLKENPFLSLELQKADKDKFFITEKNKEKFVKNCLEVAKIKINIEDVFCV